MDDELDTILDDTFNTDLSLHVKEADADFTAHIGKEGEHGLIKVEVPKDTKTTHPYTQTTAAKKIKELISANGFPPEMFNKYLFGRIKGPCLGRQSNVLLQGYALPDRALLLSSSDDRFDCL